MANASNKLVKESITKALLLLMEKKPYSEICVTEPTKKAGVGHVSFYRNYESKEEVLLRSYCKKPLDSYRYERESRKIGGAKKEQAILLRDDVGK